MEDILTVTELVAGDPVAAAWPPRLVVVDLDQAVPEDVREALSAYPGVVVGVASRPLSDAAAAVAEACTVTLAPGGPGRAWAGSPADLPTVQAMVADNPHAAATLVGLLRLTSRLNVVDGLVVESLAYSMLLASGEFGGWRARTPRRPVTPPEEPVVLMRDGDVLSVVLNNPERHNAFGRAVRDGLVDALRLVALDDSIRHVRLSGNGRSFCSGGDLDEFGTATDVAAAHLVRLRQSAAALVHGMADRVTVRLHGACIGAGIEIPSFAGRVEAAPGTWFMLPELRMGLVPGAGGTVGIPRRIGQWRTAYMALTGARVDLDTAMRWGLVDARG